MDVALGQRDMTASLGPDLRFQLRLCKIEAAARGTIVRNGLTLEVANDSTLLASLIEVFDTQAREVIMESPSRLSRPITLRTCDGRKC